MPPFIQVKSGAPEVPQDFQEGTYPLLLTEISDPKTVLAQKGKLAGQEVDLIDWTFVIDDNESAFDQLEIRTTTSTNSGPKSRMFGVLTALLGGRAPAIDQGFEKKDLIGRRVFGTINLEESGYLRINNITALPASMLQKKFAAATGTPTSGTPVRAANAAPLNLEPAGSVAVADKAEDDLPF